MTIACGRVGSATSDFCRLEYRNIWRFAMVDVKFSHTHRCVCELQPHHHKVVSVHTAGEMRCAIETITADLALFTMPQYG